MIGLAAVTIACLDAVSAFVLRDSALMLFYSTVPALVAAVFAVGVWASPNQMELILHNQRTKRILPVLGLLSAIALVAAIATLVRK